MSQALFATPLSEIPPPPNNGHQDPTLPQPTISIASLLNPPPAVGCACDPIKGYETTNGFSTSYGGCDGSWISIFSCDNVPGATLNDNPATVGKTEYDLAGATTLMGLASNTRALFDSGGSCLMNYSLKQKLYTQIQVGGAGHSMPARDRSVCPASWHIPSACEFLYLYHSSGAPLLTGPDSNSPSQITGFIYQSSDILSSGNRGYAVASTPPTPSTIFWLQTNSTNELRNGFIDWITSSPGTLNVRCIHD